MRLRDIAPLVFVLVACSTLNREGPDVTCADLGDGATNACADGIIAACTAGEMGWSVCSDEKACEQSWQVEGQYRCKDSDPVPGPTGGSGGSGGSAGSGVGGAGGSGGACEPGSVNVCENDPTGKLSASGEPVFAIRYCQPDSTWTACLGERYGCIEYKSGGWESYPAQEHACTGRSDGSIIACKVCAGFQVCGAFGSSSGWCLTPYGFVPVVACGVPGTVVRNNTAMGETYCLANGTLFDRGGASGYEVPPTSNACGKVTADDLEPCAVPAGTSEVCCTQPAKYARVCRATGKWSACFQF